MANKKTLTIQQKSYTIMTIQKTLYLKIRDLMPLDEKLAKTLPKPKKTNPYTLFELAEEIYPDAVFHEPDEAIHDLTIPGELTLTDLLTPKAKQAIEKRTEMIKNYNLQKNNPSTKITLHTYAIKETQQYGIHATQLVTPKYIKIAQKIQADFEDICNEVMLGDAKTATQLINRVKHEDYLK